MKVPLSWLKEYVDITVPPEELAYTLTMAGLKLKPSSISVQIGAIKLLPPR